MLRLRAWLVAVFAVIAGIVWLVALLVYATRGRP